MLTRTMDAAPPFIVLSLPRSRSAWLSQFLSYGGRTCGHDIGIDCASVADFVERMRGLDGTAETGAVIAYPTLLEMYPNATFVIIRRPLAEVKASLKAHGVVASPGDLERKAAMLDAIPMGSRHLLISYEHLASEEGAAAIFEACLRIPFDRAWWLEMKDRNVQVDIPATMKRLVANASGLAALRAELSERQGSVWPL